VQPVQDGSQGVLTNQILNQKLILFSMMLFIVHFFVEHVKIAFTIARKEIM